MPRFRNTRSDNTYRPYQPSTDQRAKESDDPFSMSGLPTPISSSKPKSKERHSRLLRRKRRPPPLHLPSLNASSSLQSIQLQCTPSIEAGPGPSSTTQVTIATDPSAPSSHEPQTLRTPGSADLVFGYSLPPLPNFSLLLSPSRLPPLISGHKSPSNLPSPPTSPAGSGLPAPRIVPFHDTSSMASEKRSVHFPPDVLHARSPSPVASFLPINFTSVGNSQARACMGTGFPQSPFHTPEQCIRTKDKKKERRRGGDSLKDTIKRAARAPSHPYAVPDAPARPRFGSNPFIGPPIRCEEDIREKAHPMTRASEGLRKKTKRSKILPRSVDLAPRSPSPPSRHPAVQFPFIDPYSRARTVAERLSGSRNAYSGEGVSIRRRAREERRLRGVGGNYQLDRAQACASSGPDQQPTPTYRNHLYQARRLSHSSLRYQVRFNDFPGTMSVSEAMDVDIVLRDARAGPEISPLYNMFAGAFSTIPKPPSDAEYIPSFAYPSGHDLSSPSFLSSVDSSVAHGYKRRTIPCLSDSAYYVPTYTFTDTKRTSSISPSEVNFPPLCISLSTSQSEETEADNAPITPPQLSPMMITPPKVSEPVKQVPTPEPSPGRRHLRRIVPKPYPADSIQVSSLHSPPLEYPYPYAATDRPYNVLPGSEEGSLIEQLGLMSMGAIALAARRRF